MAFLAAALISVTVYELAAFSVRCVMARSAAGIFQAFDVIFMGEDDLRPSQSTENIFMAQNVFFLLGHWHLPPDGAR